MASVYVFIQRSEFHLHCLLTELFTVCTQVPETENWNHDDQYKLWNHCHKNWHLEGLDGKLVNYLKVVDGCWQVSLDCASQDACPHCLV